jgi:hypothetical protein
MNMLASVSFGSRNTGLDVYYQILNSDKTVYVARTNTGVTELHPSSGTFGVELDSNVVGGKTILWDIEGTDKTAAETFTNEAMTVASIRTAVWDAVARTLTSALSDEDIQDITDSIAAYLLGQFSVTGYIVVGRGRGSTTFTDFILSGADPAPHVVVKAYAKTNGLVDWDHLLGMDITDQDGKYILYLNPGIYVLSIEKKYVQITTLEITVA